jgi:mono/diheme cytochrome c family protein
MRLRTLAATAFLALLAAAAVAADVERGRALYESACIGCHGRSVHARARKSVHSCAELRTTVARFARTQGRNWDAEDLDDVTAWLNHRYYGFPEEQGRCLAAIAARAAVR